MQRISTLAAVSCAISIAQAEGTVSWQQVGGSLQVDAGLKGIVSQGYTTPFLEDGSTPVRSGFLVHPLLVNNAPFVASPLADLVLAPGHAPVVISLDTVFADLEGSLSFSVVTSGPGTAAGVVGKILTLSTVSAEWGNAMVVVAATDGTYSVSDTFTVQVQGTTGIAARKPLVAPVRSLAVALPKVMALAVTGSGFAELGSSVVRDEEHCLGVNLLLPAAGTISVNIFDQLGTPVISLDRTVTAADLLLLEPSSDARRILPVNWNLRASNGAAVGAGVYLWKIEMRTVDGQKLESIKRLGVKEVK